MLQINSHMDLNKSNWRDCLGDKCSIVNLQLEIWVSERGFQELASDTKLTDVKSNSLQKYLGFIETVRVVCFFK